MAEKFLASESLEDFLSDLMQIGTLHGPTINHQGVVSLNTVASISDLRLDYQRTLLPPKKYLLPPKQETLHFESATGYSLPASPTERIVLFGLHACDLASIAYLDRVFLEDRPDPGYQSRRSNLVLIGISCEPDEFCFCGELGINSSLVPYDIFLSKGEGGFIVLQGSQLGAEIIMGSASLTGTTRHEGKPAAAAETAGRIAHAVQGHETFDESPLWNDFAGRCLSCGACSLCCPTCYCLDVREYGALDRQTAKRIQEWDNCLFKAHGEVAGGLNFRKTRQERFRYRFLHKYYGFGPLRDIISCVGCGRCREVCPVRIDLLELFCEQSNQGSTK